MKINPYLLRKQIWILLILGLLAFTSCTNVPPSDGFPQELFLTLEDLPENWIGDQITLEDSEFAVIGFKRFVNKNFINIPTISILHTINLFPNELEATNNYTDLAIDFLPSNWHMPDDFTFSPINENDKFDIKCLDQIINSKYSRICGFLQHHANIIMVIRVLIEEETLSMAEFIYAVKQVDIRLQDY